MKTPKSICSLTFLMAFHFIYAQPVLLRGPYLQMATSSSIMIKWRTDIATTGLINYGTTISFGSQKTETINTTEHALILTGLNPHTKYFYRIGDASNVLQSDTGNYFYTLPVAGTESIYRIAAFGDCGNNSVNQVNVKNQLLNYIGSNYLDAWLLMGDNAYNGGLETEFQSNFFNIYKNDLLKKYPLFPSPGNHDYDNNSSNQISHNVPYFNIFNTFTNGEAGGSASGTEAYYSFDLGNIHFLSLDSYGIDNNSYRMYDTLGPQAIWVKKDLAANTNKGWIVAYFHHPPYTFGSHNSDNETELVKIRQNFIKILERYNVDVVMSGHSHVYERSSLMHNYIGLNADFNPSIYDISTSKGTYDGTNNSCPYVKSNNQNGTVYLVAGSAGQLGGTQPGFPMNAMQFSDAAHGGVLMLEVQANRLDGKWIGADGQIRDKFTMFKQVNKSTTINITQGDMATLTASYVGNYMWSNASETTQSIQVTPAIAGSYRYIVQDGLGCIRDTFDVNVASVVLPIQLTHFSAVLAAGKTALLNWTSVFEKNSASYLIETSNNGLNYTTTASIPSKNNATGFSYSYSHKNLQEGYNYFRLKLLDNDGHFTYSETIVLFVGNAAKQISAFPNPCKNRLTITGTLIDSKLILTNVNGNTLLQQSTTGRGIDYLNTSNLPMGTYLLKVIDMTGKITTLKVVKD